MGIDARMLWKIPGEVTAESLLEWSWRLYDAFGTEAFCGPPLSIIEDEYWQDGPSLHPPEDETWINVSLLTRFYGPNYERGNIITICAVAEWAEVNIPNVTVLYGGDSSGMCVEPFNQVDRAQMLMHFYKNGHLPYLGIDKKNLCVECGAPTRCGWTSGGKEQRRCLLCGVNFTIDRRTNERVEHKWPNWGGWA